MLAAARREKRTLLTWDTDFADVRRYPLGSHSGIVVFRLRDQRWATLQPVVEALLEEGELEELGGGLAIVEESRVRVRRSK